MRVLGSSPFVAQPSRQTLLSMVTPAFNESKNLPLLYERLCRAMRSAETDWEWLIIDDHSADSTFEVITGLTKRDSRVKGVGVARNSVAHTALTCGLHRSNRVCVIGLSADL